MGALMFGAEGHKKRPSLAQTPHAPSRWFRSSITLVKLLATLVVPRTRPVLKLPSYYAMRTTSTPFRTLLATVLVLFLAQAVHAAPVPNDVAMTLEIRTNPFSQRIKELNELLLQLCGTGCNESRRGFFACPKGYPRNVCICSETIDIQKPQRWEFMTCTQTCVS